MRIVKSVELRYQDIHLHVLIEILERIAANSGHSAMGKKQARLFDNLKFMDHGKLTSDIIQLVLGAPNQGVFVLDISIHST